MNKSGSKKVILTVAALLVFSLMAVAPEGVEAAENIGAGTIMKFGVMAGSTITNTGPTVINGDVGLFPGTAFTQENATINGEGHITDDVANEAQVDLTTTYNNASGVGEVNTIAAELGGETLTPGAYDSIDGSFQITGKLTLDAQGDSEAVFIFKSASSLITASESTIEMINGTNSCQIFWVVGSSATLGTDSEFAGTILATTSITANNGANIQGRLLAINGAVTLENNVINANTCYIAPYTAPVVEEEPAVEEEIVEEEPVVEEIVEEEIVEEEPVVEEPVVEEPLIGSSIDVTKVVVNEAGDVIEDDKTEFTFELFQKVAEDWVTKEVKTTIGNSTVRFENLTEGLYIVKEINIPEGYHISSEGGIEILLADGEVGEIEIINVKEAPIVTDVPEKTVEVEKFPETGTASENFGLMGLALIAVGVIVLKTKKVTV